MRALILLWTALMIVGCAKPTDEECKSAVVNLQKVMAKSVFEGQKQMINEASPYAAELRQEIDKRIQEVESAPVPEAIDKPNMDICKKQTKACVTCVSASRTMDEMVKNCGIKKGEGGPGETTYSWPKI